MARDLLYEESALSVKCTKEMKLYTVFKVLAVIFFVLSAIVALTFFMTILPVTLDDENITAFGRIFTIVSWLLFLVAFLGTGFLFWLFKNRFNVSYDYLFVQDELRITKVFNGRKRKFVTTIHADQILKLGWADRDSFQDTLRGLNGRKPKFMTPNREPAEGKEFIYILVTSTLEKALYVIECRREMLEYLVFVAGRNKLDQR